jgi:hypothetical protein
VTDRVIDICRCCGHQMLESEWWSLENALFWVEDCMRWWGKVLTGDHMHWCYDWDALPIDESCREMDACTCTWKDAQEDHRGPLIPA